ncbi:MAG: phosphatidylglycerophosphatase A [Casimicrobiaceae bacterium]
MKGEPPAPRFMLTHPAHFYALGFGAGLARAAPGTFGTAVALPIAAVLWHTVGDLGFVVALVVLGALGVWAAQITGRDLAVPDHGAIVCDEVVSFLLVLFFTGPDVRMIAMGFVLFRFFDVVKPPPIRWFDTRWKNGAGVMADDLLAAGYTLIVLALLRRWLA